MSEKRIYRVHILPATRRFYYERFKSFVYGIPISIAIVWTTLPSLEAFAASFRLGFRLENILELTQEDKEIKRAIQKHFLYYDVYIPMEDIILEADLASRGLIRRDLNEACGKGNIKVWIPYTVRLPILGEKLAEKCQSF